MLAPPMPPQVASSGLQWGGVTPESAGPGGPENWPFCGPQRQVAGPGTSQQAAPPPTGPSLSGGGGGSRVGGGEWSLQTVLCAVCGAVRAIGLGTAAGVARGSQLVS